jgi:hypothetical protein
MLEDRRLLSAFDLAGIAGANPDPNPNTIEGFGVVQDTGTGSILTGRSLAMMGRQSTSDSNSSQTANNDNFQDILIGGSNRAFLWLGSAESPSAIRPWVSIPDEERIGTITELGATNQTPSQAGGTAYNYDGVTFITSSLTTNLGVSVANAGDIDRDGLMDMLIGAPGTDSVYLVFGSSQFRTLSTANKQAFNLDSPPPGNFRIIRFVGTNISGVGLSVAGVGNVFGSADDDILIGAPDFTGDNFQSSGAVYLVSGTAIRNAATGTSYNLVDLGTSSGIGGVGGGLVIRGTRADGNAGIDVSRAGDINDDGTPDFLINDVGIAEGRTYLIYGGGDLNSLPTTGQAGFSLSQVGTTGTNSIAGAVFLSDPLNNVQSVAGAGDYDNDGIDDLILGLEGQATLLYGARGANTLSGTYNLTALPTTVASATFLVASNFTFGASVSSTRSIIGPTLFTQGGVDFPNVIVNDSIDDLIIGDAFGSVWVIPGRTTTATGATGRLTGTIPMTVDITTGLATLNSMYLYNTDGSFSSPSQAVSGLLGTGSSTTDGDNVPDIAISGLGTIYVIEGALLGQDGDDDDDDDDDDVSGSAAAFVYRPVNLMPFGSRFVPTVPTLTKLTWQRLPNQARTQQYRPNGYYANRLAGGTIEATSSSKNKWASYRTSTLGWGVATRGKYAKGLFDARKLKNS